MLEEAILQFNNAKNTDRDSTEPLDLLGDVLALFGRASISYLVMACT